MLTSFTHNGGRFPVPDAPRYVCRYDLIRWTTPVDEKTSCVIAWRRFRKGDDPRGLTDKSKVSSGTTNFYGQGPDPSYEQRQRDPGDYDAWVSQGPRKIHAQEYRGFTDRGVAKARRLLRTAIRSVAAGNTAPQSTDHFDGVIPTYVGDTMLRIPAQSGRDDGAILKEISIAAAEIYKSGNHLTGAERNDLIRSRLKDYEASWQ